MTRPIRLPQIPQAEKDRRAAARKEEMAIEDAKNEAYLARLNKGNRIGVKSK